MTRIQKTVSMSNGNSVATSTTTLDDLMPSYECEGPAGIVYKGARYIAKFADPIEWNSQSTYEYLTVVQNEGDSYVSKQNVPVGVDISNTEYWLHWADYNAQIEQYRKEVEEVKEKVWELSLFTPFVTPEMYGAKCDGVTDDTVAFQKALDTGLDVWLTPSKEGYLVSSALHVRGKFRVVFSTVEPYYPATVKFSGTGSVFMIHEEAVKFENVSIVNSDNTVASGTAFDFSEIAVTDSDAQIINCSVSGFETAVEFYGRGLRFENNSIGNCDNVVNINWKSVEGGAWYNDNIRGSRRTEILNTAFHHIRNSIVNLKSGTAYGLKLCDCKMDVGSASVCVCESKPYDWLISGNSFNFIGDGKNIISFQDGCEGVSVFSNSFSSYVVGESIYPTSFVSATGTVNRLCAVGNTIPALADITFVFDDVKNTIIASNTSSTSCVRMESDGCYVKLNTVDNLNITGNFVQINGNITRFFIIAPENLDIKSVIANNTVPGVGKFSKNKIIMTNSISQYTYTNQYRGNMTVGVYTLKNGVYNYALITTLTSELQTGEKISVGPIENASVGTTMRFATDHNGVIGANENGTLTITNNGEALSSGTVIYYSFVIA